MTSFRFGADSQRADTDDEADADLPRALESFRLLCGDADCEALRGFLSRVSEGDSDVSPIILSPDADKAHRLVGLIFPILWLTGYGGNLDVNLLSIRHFLGGA